MAVYVLWLRQIKKQLRSKARIIGGLGQPILFLVAFGYGFGAVFSQAGQGNYMNFLAPGIIGMAIIFSAMFAGIEVIWDRQFGFLKETLVAPVTRVGIVIGRTLGGATIAFVQGLIVFVISILIGFRPHNLSEILITLLIMAITAILFTGLGTAIASRMQDMQAFPIIMNFIMMPLFFLSGSLFPLGDLPKVMKTVIDINPLSYGMDALRGSLTGLYHYGLRLDLLVMVTIMLMVMLVATELFKRIEV